MALQLPIAGNRDRAPFRIVERLGLEAGRRLRGTGDPLELPGAVQRPPVRQCFIAYEYTACIPTWEQCAVRGQAVLLEHGRVFPIRRIFLSLNV